MLGDRSHAIGGQGNIIREQADPESLAIITRVRKEAERIVRHTKILAEQKVREVETESARIIAEAKKC